jgi:long-chain acyl-CoA synthetase
MNNVGQIFETHAKVEDRTAIRELATDREVSYADLDRGCDAVARGLQARGLKRGDRVAILALNSIKYVETMLGAMRLGCVAVPLNPKIPVAVTSDICKDADVKLLFVDAECRAACPDHVPRIDLNSSEYDEELKRSGPPVTSIDPNADEPALQPYTSGSTGRPKGVLLGHRGQIWIVQTGAARLHSLRPTDRMLLALPLYHMFGLIQLQFALHAGCTVILQDRFSARAFIEAIPKYKATRIAGVSSMYSLIFEQEELLAKTDLSSVVTAAVGSSPYCEPVFANIKKYFPKAWLGNGYGITEAGGGGFLGPHPEGKARPLNSLGYPLAEVELKLVGGPSPDQGVLTIKSPGVMLGYHNLPEVTAKRLRDGWLDTGDMCRRDADGFYYFVGRDDDMFKCGGENVYPREVEALLEKHPSVAQAVVVSVDHAVKGKVPVAFVVAQPGHPLEEKDVKEWTLKHGAAFQHPRRVYVEKSLPLTGSYKVDVLALRARAVADNNKAADQSGS